MNDLTYVSFDPGGRSVDRTHGVCTWDELGNLMMMYTMNMEELDAFLIECEKYPTLTTFIYEGYAIRKDHLQWHAGSKVETAQTIGAIKSAGRRMSLILVEQPASILGTAPNWSGMPMPKNHRISHGPSAYNHGYYYLYKTLGILKPRVLERLKKKG